MAKKYLKIGALVLGGLVLLIIAALITASLMFDPNDYRDRISAAVKEKTGRELTLGKIELKIFPWLNVSISDARLSNAPGFGDAPFAEMAKVAAGVKLMPLLLDKQIQVSAISLEGLHVNLAKDKTGKSNWEDLLKQEEKPKEPKSKAESQFDLDSIDIAGVSISDAAVTYSDAQTGEHYEIKKLKLKTGALAPNAPIDIDLALSVLSKAPAAQADIAFSGIVRPDFKTGKFTTKDLKLAVNGLQVKLSKDKNGRSNWEHLLKPKTDVKEEPKATAESSFDLSSIDIASISIKDSAIVYSDAQSGAHYEVSKLAFKTGAFTPGSPCDIDLSASVTSKAPAANVDVGFSGTLKPDFKTNKLDTKDLKLTVKGKAQDLDVAATVKTRLIADLTAQIFNLQDLSVETDVAGKDVPNGKQSIKLGGSVAYNGKQGAFRFQNGKLTAADLVLSTDITGTGLNGDKPRLSGPITLARFTPRKLAETFGIKLNTADPKAISEATLSTQYNGTFNSANLQNLVLTLDQTSIKGNLAVEDFKTLAIVFALKLDSIDADRYLPPKTPPPAKQAQTGSPTAELNKIELPAEALNKLNANGTFEIGKLKINNLSLSNIRLKLAGKPGAAKEQSLSAQLYGGSVSLNHRFTPGATAGYALKSQLTSFEAAPFLKDLLGKDYVSGTADLALDISGRGKTVGELRKTLNGTVSALAKNGAVKGFNLGQIIRRGEAALAGNLNYQETSAPETDFSNISVSGKLANGVLSSDDLAAASPLFRVGGSGQIDLANETINYTARPTIVETSKGQGGKELAQLDGVTIPIRLTGNLFKPKYKIDVQEAVKQKATEKVREQIKGKETEIKEKINDKIGDLLFGKKRNKAAPQEPAPEPAPAPAPATEPAPAETPPAP